MRVAPVTDADRDALSALLVETVAANGSVGFMHPLPLAEADAFWTQALASAARGERIILGAWRDGVLVGTGTLVLIGAPSQPHRAELTKVMTTRSVRGGGIGAALVGALEQAARDAGRTLITLDATVIEGATSLYRRLGYEVVGVLENYVVDEHHEVLLRKHSGSWEGFRRSRPPR